MKVVFTGPALRDLDAILAYIGEHYPAAYDSFERRLRAVLARLSAWPESAAQVVQRPGIRVVPLIRYPYKLFYRVLPDRIEIVHIHHAARQQISERG